MNTQPNQFRDPLPPDEAMLEPAGQFAADLRSLRSAVHRAGERQTAQPVACDWLIPAKRRHRAVQRRLMLTWGLVTTCAVLLCIGALPFLRHTPAVLETPHAVAQTQAGEIDDTALLEQVDTAISAPVPSSLAPLATL